MERTRHELSTTDEYRIYRAMLARCENSRNSSYRNYGGRGIVICERWKESFLNFLADMGKRPSSQHSIERKDVNGPYSPGNCIWIPMSLQAKNRRCCMRFDVNGTTVPASDAAEMIGASGRQLRQRVHRGWDKQSAINRPFVRADVVICSRGESKTIAKWSRTSGVPTQTISHRISAGWNVDDAIWTPPHRTAQKSSDGSLRKRFPSEYLAWKNLRALKVKRCARWGMFENFISDMGPKPSVDHLLLRLDYSLPASKKNCIWGTRADKAEIDPRTKRYVFRGQLATIREVCEIANLPYLTIKARIKSGIDFDRAMSMPIACAKLEK